MLRIRLSNLFHSVGAAKLKDLSKKVLEQTNNIGYEPADLTVHPPPQNCRGWVHFFRIGLGV